MTHDRHLHVGMLARVEGEAAMSVEVEGDEVTSVRLEIFEPPRFFEALLRGRAWTEPPDITARICGICPVAYQMSACAAIEDACGVTVPEPLQRLRRLLYCGEWIESHALHIFLLHAPDFLGYESAIAMARDHREVVELGLRLKKAGNAIMTVVGGRAVHPVNVRVGGFYRLPGADELAALAETLTRARDDALATVALVAGFEFPDFEQDCEYLALRPAAGYPLEAGTVVSTGGLSFPAAAYEEHVVEEHAARSNALHARLHGTDPFVTGPLARYSLNSAAPVPAGPGGRRRGRARRRVPQPVHLHRGPRRGTHLRVRRGAAADRRMGRRARARRRGAAGGRHRLRGDRGAPRDPLPPVRTGGGRDHPGRPHRAADLAEPAEHRARPARVRPGPAGPAG